MRIKRVISANIRTTHANELIQTNSSDNSIPDPSSPQEVNLG